MDDNSVRAYKRSRKKISRRYEVNIVCGEKIKIWENMHG